MKTYPPDFTLYDHYVHAIEYLGYNFDKGLENVQTNERRHTFSAGDDEWTIEFTVKMTRRE